MLAQRGARERLFDRFRGRLECATLGGMDDELRRLTSRFSRHLLALHLVTPPTQATGRRRRRAGADLQTEVDVVEATQRVVGGLDALEEKLKGIGVSDPLAGMLVDTSALLFRGYLDLVTRDKERRALLGAFQRRCEQLVEESSRVPEGHAPAR